MTDWFLRDRRDVYEAHFRRMWPDRHRPTTRRSLRQLAGMLRRVRIELGA